MPLRLALVPVFGRGAAWDHCFCTNEHGFNEVELPESPHPVVGLEQGVWEGRHPGPNLLCTPSCRPRAGAIAERLWSSNLTTNMDFAFKRLSHFRCELLR